MKQNRISMLFFYMLLLTLFLGNRHVLAKQKEPMVSREAYIKQLQGKIKAYQKENEQIQTYLEEWLESKPKKEQLTQKDCIITMNQIDEFLYGTGQEDPNLIAAIRKKNRIHGLEGAPEAVKKAMYHLFFQGIFVGKSNGTYTHTRLVQLKEGLTKKEIEAICVREFQKEQRKKISPDGQVIRETKLPKNSKNFSYILESVPNEFYEKKFHYQMCTYYFHPKELRDYATPARLYRKPYIIVYLGAHNKMEEKRYKMRDIVNNHIDQWCHTLEENLKCRLNFNYKTSGQTWLNALRSTYDMTGSKEENQALTNEIKQYMRAAKKNKVILKTSHIFVEPSTLYYDFGYYLRAHIRFQIVSATEIPDADSKKQEEKLIYGSPVYLKHLTRNKWMTRIFDFEVGSCDSASLGDDFVMLHDDFVD